jgi:hypothetical protein
MNEARADRMMDLAVFKQEYLEGWQRSKTDKEVQTQEKISSSGKTEGQKPPCEPRAGVAIRPF